MQHARIPDPARRATAEQLAPELRDLLTRMEFFPGLQVSQAQHYASSTSIEAGLEQGLLTLRHTAAGPTLSQGPAWRAALGLHPAYNSPSTVLEDSVYMEAGVRALEAEGFEHKGMLGRSLHHLTRAAETVYATGTVRGIRARTIRRHLKEQTGHLIRTQAKLIIFHPKTRYTRDVDRKNFLLTVMQLPPPWTTPTRQRGSREASQRSSTAASAA